MRRKKIFRKIKRKIGKWESRNKELSFSPGAVPSVRKEPSSPCLRGLIPFHPRRRVIRGQG